jgi:hypothetical protein
MKGDFMKGTEGIDYVITECGHCKGAGRCDCYDCYKVAAIAAVPRDEDGYYKIAARDVKIEELNEKKYQVKCDVCQGVGKVVFWRE